MRRKVSLTLLCATLLLTLSLTAFGEQVQPPRPAAPPQTPPANPPSAEKSFDGSLTKVDLAAKLITIKGAEDKEMMFVYDADTQITGIDNSPQGLATKTGTRLKVTYRENRGVNMATKIEAAAPSRS